MANIQALGELINWVDVRNKGVISDNLLGINIDKFFMPSVANIIGTDLSSYKLIRNKQFACNPMHVGRDEKMPIALYMDDSPSIVSPAYFVFEVKDAAKINPEYLMLWFRRAEFDRECWYHTDGSVRGGITWDEILEMTVPVPSIEEQNELVKSYRDIERRIQIKKDINDNLESIAHTLFNSWFVDFEPFEHTKDDDGNPELPLGWEYSTLESCIDFLNGYAFKSEDLIDEEIPDSYDVFKMGHIKKGGGLNYSGTKSWIPRSDCKELNRFVLQYGDILMCMTDMKENIALLGHTAFMDIEDKYIVNQRVGLLRPNNHKNVSPYFLYLLTNNAKFLRELRKNAHIGVQVNLSKEDIVNSRIVLAPSEVNEQFASKVKPLFDTIFKNNAEIRILEKLAVSIQTQLSR